MGIQACPWCPPEPAFKELQDGLSGRKEGEPSPPILRDAAFPGEQAGLPSPRVPPTAQAKKNAFKGHGQLAAEICLQPHLLEARMWSLGESTLCSEWPPQKTVSTLTWALLVPKSVVRWQGTRAPLPRAHLPDSSPPLLQEKS